MRLGHVRRALARVLPPVLVLTVVVPIVMAPPAKAAPYHTVPGQYISKLYTEAYGRAPTGPEWNQITSYFTANQCDWAGVTYWGRTIYKYSELDVYYPVPDPSPTNSGLAARITALYRGAINRDPTATELAGELSAFAANETLAYWYTVVDRVFDGPAHYNLATQKICRGALAGGNTINDPSNYEWNYDQIEPPNNFPRDTRGGAGCLGTGGAVTRAALQAAIDSAPANGTVKLAQGTYVWLDGPLYVRAGKTLRTCGPADAAGLPDPTPARYALQARFIRTWNRAVRPAGTWTAPVVNGTVNLNEAASINVEAGAKLERVWVDGNRDRSENMCFYDWNGNPLSGSGTAAERARIGSCTNVNMLSGTGTSLTFVRSDNFGSTTSVGFAGAHGGYGPCNAGVVEDNVVLGYSTGHGFNAWNVSMWGDGIAIQCEDASVRRNTVVDATDIPIITFRACVASEACWNTFPNNRVQRSQIIDNKVLAAGNSAWAGIFVSTTETGQAGATDIAYHDGMNIQGNQIWTSLAARLHALVHVGLRADVSYPSPGYHIDFSKRTNGVTVSNNTTAGATAMVNIALIASGALNNSIHSNSFGAAIVAAAGWGGLPVGQFPGWRCPTRPAGFAAPILVEISSPQGLWFWYSGTTNDANNPIWDAPGWVQDPVKDPHGKRGCISAQTVKMTGGGIV